MNRGAAAWLLLLLMPLMGGCQVTARHPEAIQHADRDKVQQSRPIPADGINRIRSAAAGHITGETIAVKGRVVTSFHDRFLLCVGAFPDDEYVRVQWNTEHGVIVRGDDVALLGVVMEPTWTGDCRIGALAVRKPDGHYWISHPATDEAIALWQAGEMPRRDAFDLEVALDDVTQAPHNTHSRRAPLSPASTIRDGSQGLRLGEVIVVEGTILRRATDWFSIITTVDADPQVVVVGWPEETDDRVGLGDVVRVLGVLDRPSSDDKCVVAALAVGLNEDYRIYPHPQVKAALQTWFHGQIPAADSIDIEQVLADPLPVDSP